MEYLISFSTDYEDIILYHVLHDVSNVFWIDVGANDPVFASVTKFFSIRGGCGINIEPLQQFNEKYAIDRPNEINLNIGISDKSGYLNLYGYGQGASYDKKGNIHTKGYSPQKTIVKTLKQVCLENINQKKDIHFLKIDVENWERQCLLGMDFEHYRPWIVCIESTIPNTMIPNYQEWEDLLTSRDYRFVYSYSVNRFYVDCSRSELMERFADLNKTPIYELYNIVQWNYINGIKREKKKQELVETIKKCKLLVPLKVLKRKIESLKNRK